MSSILLVIGLAGLWGGTLLTVRGAVRLSKRYGISEGFIGLAILSLGTDLPELVVALSGSVQQLRGVDASGVIVGSAIGSTIAQGSVVLGIAGLVGYLPVAPRMVRRDGAVLILAIVLAGAVIMDGTVGRVEGLVMVIAYGMYFVSLINGERRRDRVAEVLPSGGAPAPVEIIVGLVILTIGAHLAVTGVLEIAAALGITQTLIGVILVGAGTSLPELALSLRAASEGRARLSVGNVLGSNIFDMLVPVGVAAAIHDLLVQPGTILFDFPALIIISVLLLVFLTRRRGLQRTEAVVLVGAYVIYAALRVGAAVVV
jgi:cation:H+ antiporter